MITPSPSPDRTPLMTGYLHSCLNKFSAPGLRVVRPVLDCHSKIASAAAVFGA